MNFKKLSRFSLLSMLLIISLLLTSSIALGDGQASSDYPQLTIKSQGYYTNPIKVSINKAITGNDIPDGAATAPYGIEIWKQGNTAFAECASSITVGNPWIAELDPGTYTVSEPDPKGATVLISPETFTLTEDMQSWWKLYMTIKSDGWIYNDSLTYEVLLNDSIIDGGQITNSIGPGDEYTIEYYMNDTSQHGTYKIHVKGWYDYDYLDLWSNEFEYNSSSQFDGVVVTNDFSTCSTHTLTIEKKVKGDYTGTNPFVFDVCHDTLDRLSDEHISPDGSVNIEGLNGIYYVKETDSNGAINTTYAVDGTPVEPDGCGYVEVDLTQGDVTLAVTNCFEEEPDYNVVVNKTIKGNKAPDDPHFNVCFEYDDIPRGQFCPEPDCFKIHEGRNEFLLEPGIYNVYEECYQEPESINIDKEQITVPESGVVEINITNDYGNTSSRRHRSGGGGIVEEFPTPPPLPEPIIVTTPEPAAPVEVIEVPVEPAPELPNTGAPFAAGLGLLLAAGGLAIRRIKK